MPLETSSIYSSAIPIFQVEILQSSLFSTDAHKSSMTETTNWQFAFLLF